MPWPAPKRGSSKDRFAAQQAHRHSPFQRQDETSMSNTQPHLSPWTTHPARSLGRALVGVLFLVSGALKIGKFAGIAGSLASKGLPASELLTVLTIALEIAGGLALIVGWRTKEAALALAFFCIPATLLYHAFWSVDAAAFGNQLNHFLKNLAILGALVMIAFPARGQGPVNP